MPIPHVCDDRFGLVTVRNGSAIAKLTLLTSLIDGSLTDVTRIRASLVSGPVTVQLKVPLVAPFLTDAAMTLKVAPASRLISTFTSDLAGRLCDH